MAKKFQRLVNKLSRKPGVRTPRKLAGYICGRKRGGKRKK